jgi:hypothetical protein
MSIGFKSEDKADNTLEEWRMSLDNSRARCLSKTKIRLMNVKDKDQVDERQAGGPRGVTMYCVQCPRACS